MRPARVLRLVVVGLLLGACAGGPPPPGPAAAPPDLLPLHQLFASREAN